MPIPKSTRVLTESRVREIISAVLRKEFRKSFSSNLIDLLSVNNPIVIDNPSTPAAAVGFDLSVLSTSTPVGADSLMIFDADLATERKITIGNLESILDHGGLLGLGDVGDHLLYLDLAGTRAMTGALNMDGKVIILSPDGNTSIEASTDGVIKLTTDTTEVLFLSASSIFVNTALDLSGAFVTLDVDNDTIIDLSVDDIINIQIEGTPGAFKIEKGRLSFVTSIDYNINMSDAVISFGHDLIITAQKAGPGNAGGNLRLHSGVSGAAGGGVGSQAFLTAGDATGFMAKVGGDVHVEGGTAKGSSKGGSAQLTPGGTASGEPGDVNCNTTTALLMPVGTTAQRPAAPTNGMIRYNTTLAAAELYEAGTWVTFGAAA